METIILENLQSFKDKNIVNSVYPSWKIDKIVINTSIGILEFDGNYENLKIEQDYDNISIFVNYENYIYDILSIVISATVTQLSESSDIIKNSYEFQFDYSKFKFESAGRIKNNINIKIYDSQQIVCNSTKQILELFEDYRDIDRVDILMDSRPFQIFGLCENFETSVSKHGEFLIKFTFGSKTEYIENSNKSILAFFNLHFEKNDNTCKLILYKKSEKYHFTIGADCKVKIKNNLCKLTLSE